MQHGKYPPPLVSKLKHKLLANSRVWLTSAGVAGCVLILRCAGLLQVWELESYDQFFWLRPREAMDERVVIVRIDEADLQTVKTWPIPDAVMAQLLLKIQTYKPRAIGLDIYRDLPVEPGHAKLQQVYQLIPNLIGIEQIQGGTKPEIAAPPILSRQDRVGFNNLVFDVDDKGRRGVLYWTLENGETRQSFALRLALEYLKAEGITPQEAIDTPGYLQLGKAIFHRFQENDGSYIQADDGGYQYLANPRGPAGSFLTVSMTDVLTGKVRPEVMRDRIVLIGSTAVSLKDFFYTSYSQPLGSPPHQIAGVELQANFISQIISSALDGRLLIQVMPEPLEWVWIVIWSWVGAQIVWRLRSPRQFTPVILLASAGLVGVGYLAFLGGWWLPVIPPLMTLVGSAVVITVHLAHIQEELKRSKEFLNSVINTIPDPVFVKDSQHRLIVLNQAYYKFLHTTPDAPLQTADYEVFPQQEAEILRQQDQQVFDSGQEQETEAEFVDSDGVIRHIATKRSLHRDAAGNLFLVGVMRDITERKRMEEELKRTAAELVRSNAELAQSANQFRHQANHDSLTGLPNRILFQERLNQAIEWARENEQLVAVLFLDLDGFKLINDTQGHEIGDLLLQAVARRLVGCLRGSDTVCRLGGDEFTVILPAIPSSQDASRVAEKILSTLSQSFSIEGRTIFITSSVGISIYPQHGNQAEVLVREADSAMYRAKELGKNGYEFAAP